ncbi:DNA topoisomerase [Chitinophaga sp. 22321]|uniref:DNA topoisomerase n=1 Tax=Chitinophaga hostae TaxID=2831022 RepID=A0ABS5IWK7_9BACT|nr:type IA DNA topoisomerase [Chitinophaga hostae]MBS0027270.1 topoisomerase C-terminal repeat-containing protein [Chitinophaga hostae]
MKAVIAEKPSVAREIAALLGATEKNEGYFEGGGYQVTWALGHLVALGMPEDYGITGFRQESLPILPDPFVLTVRKVRKNKSYEPDTGALKQLKVIDRVIKSCDSIIVATDAGREGELIFRLIYQYLQCTKPFERLWISSLTEKAIKQGFESLKPGSDFDGLYLAGQARSRADWLVGINASQALTIAAGSGIYSLGRVQTPTLALICKRYQENKNFSVQKYWQVQCLHRKEFIDFKSLSVTKWDDVRKAEEVLKAVTRTGIATVGKLDHKTVTEQPPLLFDLTGLQKEANKSLGFSAEETLNIAQTLYENKFITYPRTGSRYISDDLWPEIPLLVRALEEKPSLKEAVKKVSWGHFNKRIVNDVKVTDHHALLVTGKVPVELPAKENAIYDMIAFRLLEAVGQACQKEITDATLQVLHYDFMIKGCQIVEAGWRSIKGSFTDEENGPMEQLPELHVGDELKVGRAGVLEKKTKPPMLYTEASLLSAMENAGREIENDEERKALQGIGIGTPATRAAIIEALFTREYILREKKSLIPTDKGLQVYHWIKDKKIADVAMTAGWELILSKIESNEVDAQIFEKDMGTYAGIITRELLALTATMQKQPDLLCPKCQKEHLLFRDKVVKCSNESCNWIQFRNICGIVLTISDVENLVAKGKTGLIKGMKSKAGKKFDAYIVLNNKGETSFEFPSIKGK